VSFDHHSPRTQIQSHKYFLVILLFCMNAFSGVAFSQSRPSPLAPPRTAPPPKSAPFTDQHIALLFAGQGSADRILLTLNNNRAGSLNVTPTLYRLTGEAIKLPAIDLQQSESRLIELGESLQKSGIQGQFGYMDLAYSGRLMELGAQLTLYPVAEKGGLDSPRSLTVDFKSTERAAVAWLPDESETVVALSNVSSQVITVRLSNGSEDSPIVLGPHETVLRNHRFEPDAKKVVAFDANYDGPVDAIRIFGYVKNWKIGSFPLRFSDPSASTSASLTAIGLRTATPTHIALQNLSDEQVEYHLHFAEIGTEKPKVLDTPPARLQPHSGETISATAKLRQLSDMGVERATVTLETAADSKSFVAAATQELHDRLLEDIPFRTSNPRIFMRGAYPLRWTQDYTNRPMIANVSSIPMTVRAYVIAGEVTYAFPLRNVAPDTTAVFDVDQARTEKIPDVNGKVIPQDAKFGKFQWAPMVRTTTADGLIGRTELYSALNNRASSFSCGIICDYENLEFPFFDTDLTGLYQAPNQSAARSSTGTQSVIDSYGNFVTYPITDGSMFGNPHFETTSVLNSTVLSNNTTVQSDTGTYGATNFHYLWQSFYGQPSEDGSFCVYPVGAVEDLGGPAQVPSCAIPVGESTSFVRQSLVDPNISPTASDFIQTLNAVGSDDGSKIREDNNENGTDACYFVTSPYLALSGVTEGTWTIGAISPGSPESTFVIPGHNQWGPDLVGYGPGPVRYYQQNRARLGLGLPCGFSIHQNLTIICSQDQWQEVYKVNNPITSTIDATGLTNCRSGVCAPHFNYQ
jgi:hypothetical protein